MSVFAAGGWEVDIRKLYFVVTLSHYNTFTANTTTSMYRRQLNCLKKFLNKMLVERSLKILLYEQLLKIYFMNTCFQKKKKINFKKKLTMQNTFFKLVKRVLRVAIAQ